MYLVVVLLSLCVHDVVAQILKPVKIAYSNSVTRRDLSQLDLQNFETFLWNAQSKLAMA
jgi:hypothetical protein